MNRLAQLGEQMRSQQAWSRPPVAVLRTRNVRRRIRRAWAIAGASLVVIGTAVVVDDVGTGRDVIVDTLDAEVFDGPAEPTYEEMPSELRPSGPVDLLHRGKIGGVNWYAVVYPAAAHGGSLCAWVVDEQGMPLGGSCRQHSTGESSQTSAGLGFSQIGDADVLIGEAGRAVQQIDVSLADGSTSTTRPLRSTQYDAALWVLPLPSEGGELDALERMHALLAMVIARSPGRQEVVWPSGGVPPDDGDTPSTGDMQRLDFGGGVGLDVEPTTPSPDGLPRLCTTTSLESSRGVRSCFPVRPEPVDMRWAYLDRTSDGWVLSGVTGTETSGLSITIDGTTTLLSLLEVEGSTPSLFAFAVRLPDAPGPNGREAELRDARSLHSFEWHDQRLSPGTRQPLSYPFGEGVDPLFS